MGKIIDFKTGRVLEDPVDRAPQTIEDAIAGLPAGAEPLSASFYGSTTAVLFRSRFGRYQRAAYKGTREPSLLDLHVPHARIQFRHSDHKLKTFTESFPNRRPFKQDIAWLSPEELGLTEEKEEAQR